MRYYLSYVRYQKIYVLKMAQKMTKCLFLPELTKSIVNGIGIGFLSCIGIGIGIVKTNFQV